MILTYNLFDRLYTILEFPLKPVLAHINGMITLNNITSGFFIRMEISLVSGIAVALPFIILELWGFIEPALTPEERKPVKYLAPFSVLLFLAGIGTGYACLPATFSWMALYIVDLPGVTLMQNTQDYILLTVKIILAFGIAFQLPLVLLFLARIGLITAQLMTTYWRHATVGIAVAAAILTPSNDPLTMMMMAVPMAGLYLLSIGLVRAFEPKEDGTRTVSLLPMILVSLAPVAIIGAVGYWLTREINLQKHPATPPAVAAGAGAVVQQQSIDALTKRLDADEKKIEYLKTRLDAADTTMDALTKRAEAAEKRATASPTPSAPAPKLGR